MLGRRINISVDLALRFSKGAAVMTRQPTFSRRKLTYFMFLSSTFVLQTSRHVLNKVISLACPILSSSKPVLTQHLLKFYLAADRLASG